MDNQTLDQLISLYQKKSKTINAIVVAVVAIVVVIGGYVYFYQIPNEEKASAALYHVQHLFAKEDTSLAHYQRIVDGEAGQYRGASYIAKNYASTRAGNLAKYYAGYCLYRLGNYTQAASFLESCSIENALLQSRAYALFADVLADQKQYDQAALLYLKAAKTLGNHLTYAPMYYYRAGILYELANNLPKAQAVYEDALDKFPSEINHSKSLPGIFDDIRKQLFMIKNG